MKLNFKGSYSFILFNTIGLLAFFWPFLLPNLHTKFLQQLFNSTDSKWWTLIILPIALWFFLIDSEKSIANQQVNNSSSKTVALMGVLIALACVMRFLGAGAVGIEPIWFLLIIVSFTFGSKFGFLYGNLSLLVSGLFLGGFGPWLPFQMITAGWICAGAGFIGQITKLGNSYLKNNFAKYLLAIYSVVASFTFGLLMDLQLWPWLISSQSQLAFSIDASSLDNVRNFLIFHFSTSLAWDIPRAVLTAALMIVAGDILISALQRTINRLQLT
jgi:energy-coupling factor transport system substrate-specific component